MKADTTVMSTMAVCFAIVGFFTSFVSGLSQWMETGKMPPVIVWIVVIGSSLVGMGNSLIAFFSRSYGNWQDKKDEKQNEKASNV